MHLEGAEMADFDNSSKGRIVAGGTDPRVIGR